MNKKSVSRVDQDGSTKMSEGNRSLDKRRFSVILVQPDSFENIGLVARGMANTGFPDLRLVGIHKPLKPEAYRTAVHAEDILDRAKYFSTLSDATSGLNLVFASTVRVRRASPLMTLSEAVQKMLEYPVQTEVGLVFGNERTGLTSEELGLSNFRFTIPQVARQPSYNLGAAVTLTLYQISIQERMQGPASRETPLSRAEQEAAIRAFERMLDRKGFIHPTNRAFITDRVADIFRRTALTKKDRDIILALFRKALD